jgi:hypothetical protein
MENNANLNNSSRPHLSTFQNNNNGLVPNGILKKPPKAPPNSVTSTPKKQLMDHMEAKNESVMLKMILKFENNSQ